MMLCAISPHLIVALTMTALPIVFFVAQPFVIWARLEFLKSRNRLTRWQDRVQYRFKHSGTFAWMFAWYKIRMDPMFIDLPELLKLAPDPKVAIDLGCGFGVAGNTLLEWCPNLTLYGLDPDAARVTAAGKAFASRGTALVAGAPDFEVAGLPDQVDTVLCLDMIHYLTEAELAITLQRLHNRLQTGGYLFLRSLVPPTGEGSFLWKLQVQKRRSLGGTVNHRTADKLKEMVAAAGFTLEQSRATTGNPELHWFIARA